MGILPVESLSDLTAGGLVRLKAYDQLAIDDKCRDANLGHASFRRQALEPPQCRWILGDVVNSDVDRWAFRPEFVEKHLGSFTVRTAFANIHVNFLKGYPGWDSLRNYEQHEQQTEADAKGHETSQPTGTNSPCRMVQRIECRP